MESWIGTGTQTVAGLNKIMDSLCLHGVGNYNIPNLLTSSTYTKFSDMFLHVCTGGIMALKINTVV